MRRQASKSVPSAWPNLLRAHATSTRAMDARLRDAHGLRLNEYEVLLHLSHADDQRLRGVDLAERLFFTQSGITRLVDGLQRDGLVERAPCASDRRVMYVQLTEAGRRKQAEAGADHLADIHALFAERFTAQELEALAALLGRLPGVSGEPDEACS